MTGKVTGPSIHHDVERPVTDLGKHQGYHVAMGSHQVAGVLEDSQGVGNEWSLLEQLPHRSTDRTGDNANRPTKSLATAA